MKSKKAMTKSALFAHLAEKCDLKKAQVSAVLEHLGNTMGSELKKNGIFTLPGVCRMKIRKVKAIKGGQKKINPITKTEYITKDRPAHNKVGIRPVKAFAEGLK